MKGEGRRRRGGGGGEELHLLFWSDYSFIPKKCTTTHTRSAHSYFSLPSPRFHATWGCNCRGGEVTSSLRRAPMIWRNCGIPLFLLRLTVSLERSVIPSLHEWDPFSLGSCCVSDRLQCSECKREKGRSQLLISYFIYHSWAIKVISRSNILRHTELKSNKRNDTRSIMNECRLAAEYSSNLLIH